MSDCKQCKEYAGQLIAVANTCVSCDEALVFGGYWGWHVEGYRVGPFCTDCAGKASVARQVADPSLGS
jgi:hypothetical protein